MGIQSIYRALDSSRLPLKGTCTKTLRRIVTISVNVAVRKIRFRPDKDFHEALGKMIFENKTYKDGTSTLPIKSAVNAALKELFDESPIITVNALRRRLSLSTTYAYQLAAQLEREKKIINIGSTLSQNI